MDDLTPQAQLSPVLVTLLKGFIERERQPALWQDLLNLERRVTDYFSVIGLELMLDEVEGYAYLRQRPREDDTDVDIPRLISRRPLGYAVSLLCVLLRKKLVETDASGGETRVILTREQLVDMMQVFLPESRALSGRQKIE